MVYTNEDDDTKSKARRYYLPKGAINDQPFDSDINRNQKKQETQQHDNTIMSKLIIMDLQQLISVDKKN